LLIIRFHGQTREHRDQLAVESFELHGLGNFLLALAHFRLNRLVAERDYDIDDDQDENQRRPEGQENFGLLIHGLMSACDGCLL
jgi:hypothetical protein